MSGEVILEPADAPDGCPKVIRTKDDEILVVRIGDEVFAVENRCPHARGPLHLGKIDGATIECPWHGAIFNLRDGSIQRQPSPRGIRCFEARSEGGRVIIRAPDRIERDPNDYLPITEWKG